MSTCKININQGCIAYTFMPSLVNTCCKELSKCQSGEMTASYIDKALSMCKALVPGTEKIEAILITHPSQVSHSDALETLKAAAKPFMALELFYKELDQQHKLYCKKQESPST